MVRRIAVILLTIAFFGQSVAAQESWRKITPDVVYGHKMGMALTYDVVTPQTDANGAAVLFIFSGGWVSRHVPPEQLVRAEIGDNDNYWEALVKEGYTLYIVRHGSSPLFKVPDAVEDVRKAISHIRIHAEERGIDPARIGVTGWSAGGHLSLMLGTTGVDGNDAAATDAEQAGTRVAAVAAYFPPTDLAPFIKEDSDYPTNFPALIFPKEKAASVSPLNQVTPDDAPTLLVHGDADQLVPLKESEQIKEAFDKAKVPTKLIVIEGADHGFAGEDEIKAKEAVLAWFKQYLLKE